jgi:hypothetical protein
MHREYTAGSERLLDLVACYDAEVNRRVVAAATDLEASYWWGRKIAAKRVLEALSPAERLAVAERLAQELEESERAVRP